MFEQPLENPSAGIPRNGPWKATKTASAKLSAEKQINANEMFFIVTSTMIKRFWGITLKCLSFFRSFHQLFRCNRKIEKGQENDSVLQRTFVGWSRYEGEWKDGDWDGQGTLLSRGLSFKIAMGNILTLTPALIITLEQLDKALHWQILLGRWMIACLCQAMSLDQDEETIYADFDADAYNDLVETQFSNIVKLMSGLGMGESIQEKVLKELSTNLAALMVVENWGDEAGWCYSPLILHSQTTLSFNECWFRKALQKNQSGLLIQEKLRKSLGRF